MEASNDFGAVERTTAPTVSKEKWLHHARAKLARGYVLIVGTERRVANFYQAGKGYEMCAYNVAKQLVKSGLVAPVRAHHLGTVYALQVAPEELRAQTPPKPPKQAAEPAAEIEEDLLTSLEGDEAELDADVE